MNKSLNDPHTNLLRQTTEAMSAISGGISEITIRAYDDLSVKGSTDFSRRMALNVSNLLKEESYFDFVKDPLKGSNILEFLTEQIISKAWTYFKQLEQFESINDLDKIEFIRKSISETRKRRLENFEKKKMELIGINCFMNPQNEPNSWLNNETYLEMSYFIFETCQ
jgi:methylmalonyl-CoA mutase